MAARINSLLVYKSPARQGGDLYAVRLIKFALWDGQFALLRTHMLHGNG